MKKATEWLEEFACHHAGSVGPHEIKAIQVDALNQALGLIKTFGNGMDVHQANIAAGLIREYRDKVE
jgi:hypothetical protein